MLNNYLTSDLSHFGEKELHVVKSLIDAAEKQGLPNDFWDNDVKIMMNRYSGNVFLINSEYQVAMMNGDKLESWYFLSYHGYEGFLDDLLFMFDSGDILPEDFEELAVICENNGKHELAGEIRKKIEETEEFKNDL
jgi:hypothetical protein